MPDGAARAERTEESATCDATRDEISQAVLHVRAVEEDKAKGMAAWRQRKKENKKAQIKIKQDARRSMLEAMGKEDRVLFLEQERVEAKAHILKRERRMQQAFDSGVPKIVVNCSFAESMNSKALQSVAKQGQMCYLAVRDTESMVQLHFTSLDEDSPLRHFFEKVGLKHWMAHVHAESVWKLFPLEKLVVLTPDAEVDLEDVSEDCIYVIGGLVDRTVDKNRSYSQALEHGAQCTRRLPLRKYAQPGAHPVLNIDTVMRIISEVHLRGPSSWPEIFLECLPPRHSGQLTRRMRRKEERTLEERSKKGCGKEESEKESSEDEDPREGEVRGMGGEG